jgi:hypothetical protein
MQGLSTYLAALLSGNINILYGGGTAVSRAIDDDNVWVSGGGKKRLYKARRRSCGFH